MQGGFEFESRQRERRRKANGDACVAVFWEAAMAALLLWARTRYFPQNGAMRLFLLILAVIDAALIIPILIVRHQRMKEIAGGEEDEAGQY
ncbi:hypothetical protein OBV_37070 [Oscillibacter valericigenes Sjm18-20]|nr:hypothetical protein OBV_37070 [Oscillibacter valericigenes Sjm18-20]